MYESWIHMKIREAKAKDIDGIAKVHLECWNSTYSNIICKEYLKSITLEKRVNLWRQNFELGNYILVAENESNQVVGFVDTDYKNLFSANDTKVTSIYILEDYQGFGLGKQLLKEILIHLHKSGYTKVYVEVLTENKSKNFYQHFGATKVVEKEITIGKQKVSETIYVWHDLSNSIEKLSK